MSHPKHWHYLPTGTFFTACGKPIQHVFYYTSSTHIVTCLECTKTEQYIAQRMEVALFHPPASAEAAMQRVKIAAQPLPPDTSPLPDDMLQDILKDQTK